MPHESAPQSTPQTPTRESNQFENKSSQKVEGVEDIEIPTVEITNAETETSPEIEVETRRAETRRAFLLRNVRAALGLGATTVGLQEKVEAQIATHEYGEKNSESPVYKEEILEMHEIALKKKNEVFRVYFKNGDKEFWVDGAESTGIGHTIIGGKAFERASSENPEPERVDMVHTHPKRLVDRFLTKHKEIDARPNEFRSPPSIADFSLSYKFNRNKKENNLKTEFNCRAVDHTGVWTFDVSPESPIMELLAKENELVKERDEKVFEYLKDSTDPQIKQVFEYVSKLKALDPRLATDFINKDIEVAVKKDPDIAHDPSYLELKTVRDRINKNEDYKWLNNFEAKYPSYGGAEKSEEQIQEYIRRCKKLGITVTYEPIEVYQE